MRERCKMAGIRAVGFVMSLLLGVMFSITALFILFGGTHAGEYNPELSFEYTVQVVVDVFWTMLCLVLAAASFIATDKLFD